VRADSVLADSVARLVAPDLIYSGDAWCRDRWRRAERLSDALLERAGAADSIAWASTTELLLPSLARMKAWSAARLRALSERAARLREHALGPDHPDVARSLAGVAAIRFCSDDTTGWHSPLDRALTLARASGNADSVDLAATLEAFAGIVVRAPVLSDTGSAPRPARGRVAAARRAVTDSLLRRALALRERVVGPDDPSLLPSLRGLSTVAHEAGANVAAVEWKRRVAVIREATLGPDHPDLGAALHTLAYSLRQAGRLDSAAAVFGRALAIRERRLAPDDLDLAYTLYHYAATYSRKRDFGRARTLGERALAIRLAVAGPEALDTGWSFTDLGLVNEGLGEIDTARVCFERALAVFERAGGPWDPNLTTALAGISRIGVLDGNYASAVAASERLVAIEEKIHGGDALSVGGALQQHASNLYFLGDYEGARAALKRGIAMIEKAQGPDSFQLVPSLSTLVWLDSKQGDLAAAIELSRRLLRLNETRWGNDDPRLATYLVSLGNALHAVGSDAEAEANYRRALALLEDAPDRYAYGRAAATHNLALVAVAEGHIDEALNLLDRTRALDERVQGPSGPMVANALCRHATLLLVTGDTTRALNQAFEGERMGREHLILTASDLSEREALRYAAVRASALDVVLSVAARQGSASTARAAWDAVIASRALVLDEVARRHRRGVKDARLGAALTVAESQLARLGVAGGEDGDRERRAARLAEARANKERIERELARTGRDSSTVVRPPVADVSAITARLPAGSGLVAYARYEERRLVRAPATPAAKDSASERVTIDTTATYMAFVLTGGAEPRVVPLGDAAEIDSLVWRWRRQASAGARMQPEWIREEPYRAAGIALRRRVWDPVAPVVGRMSRVFVVPDGALHLVNLAALPVGERYLVETGPVVHYLSTERDLIEPPPAAPGSAGALVVGGVDFDRADPATTSHPVVAPASAAEPLAASFRGSRAICGDFRELRWSALPGTKLEADAVGGWWRRPARSRDGRALVVLDGAGATEAAFKALAPGRRVLHLATHGFFVGSRCSGSTRGGVDEAAGENPLVLSGLVLAGANRRAEAGPDEEDGVLTAQEIATLDLSGTEWAVLSACETGVGEIRAGEGVFGLRRALQVAGARTSIMSLWSVDDTATREWMSALYAARLGGHMATAEALQRASRDVLKARRAAGKSTHPFFWGAFVAAGDWR
jgi:CHAT domain-containing protein/tetratricopeptide (TPR) repeat protein